MKKGQYFSPTVNKVYTTILGSQYCCLTADRFNAEMIDIESKWILEVKGCQMYDDGKIAWNSAKEKSFTVKDFTFKSVMTEINNLSSSCDTSGSNKQFDDKLSEILTFLILRVGKYTKCYASDLFSIWKHVDKIVHTLPDTDSKDYKILFGIHENGVDFVPNITYNVNAHLHSNPLAGLTGYTGGVYMMEIHVENSVNYRYRPKVFVKFGEPTVKEMYTSIIKAKE